MSEAFWVEVEEAYNQVAELPANARTTFLNQVYRDRADIRKEVESLLEHREVAQQLRQSTVLMTAAEMFGDQEHGLIGKIIADKYLIREFLGAGGMAEVYLAEHIALEMPFALKRPRPVLRLDPDFHKRFLDEARRAVILKHENVTRVHDVIDAADDMFVVMEYIEGDTLERRMQDLGHPFTIDEFLPIAIQCGSALVAAHEKHIVHLDVKPANIMLTPAGQIKICDFGVARRLSADNSANTTIALSTKWTLAGTPAYMAPEVILGSQFDERADLFALGTVFYEMLTGENPFRDNTAIATTAKVVSHNPKPISAIRTDLDPRVERIVRRLMAKDPDQRYPSAADLVEDLTALRRARNRFQDLRQGFREAFAESRWMKAAAAAALLCLAAMPVAWIYRAPILHAVGLAPNAVEKNLVPLQMRAIGKDAQVYADGFTETLNSKLTQLLQGSEWRVAPITLIREQGVTTPDSARRELAANLVLDSSLEVAGSDGRVNLKLINTATNKAEAQTVTGPISDLFGLQDLAVVKLVDMLGLELKTGKDRATADYQAWPPKAVEYYQRGRGYLLDYQQPENIESAIEVFNLAIREYPRFALAYTGLGQAYWYKFRTQFDKTQLSEATSACEQSEKYEPKLPEAHICLGNIYNSKGEYRRALEQFQQARSGPAFDVLTGFAEAYEGLYTYDLAEKYLKQAVAQNGFNWSAYARLGSFYSRRSRFEAAEDLWNQALARSKDNPRALGSLGGILIRLGKFEEAVAALKRSLELRETLAARSNLGMAYRRMGQFEKAIGEFERANEEGKDYRVAGNLAQAYYFVGKREEALEMYEHAIHLGDEELTVNPRNADVHILLARYHAMLLQREPALEHLGAALDWNPDDWHYLQIAAMVYNQFNDPETTLRYIEKALSRGYTTLEMRSEMEFSNLHQLPKFQALLQSTPGRP